MTIAGGNGEKGMAERVLVTGASGFLGGHCILQLLAQGWDVRGTVRSPAGFAAVRARIAAAAGADPGPRLEMTAADLGRDDGWAAAAAGCAFVLHVASPFPPTQPKSDDELVAPARDGALRVVRAAAAAGVRRVVMTSSTAAVASGVDPTADDVYTEAHFNDPRHRDNTPYSRSKIIAEVAARAAAKAAGLPFVTINPSAILGPVFDADLSTSINLVRRPLQGRIPGAPRIGYAVVDVRDVADAHLRAMTADNVDGERFIASGGFLWLGEIAEILRRRYPDRAASIKTRPVPDLAIRAMALIDPVLKEPARNLGRRKRYDTRKARTVLGWSPRSDEQTVLDTAESLIRLGLA
ncbi:MAG: NAD-dependent epimerase/dehydratase family protein [Hyphomonadaceae bacterium]|nr:NAD-dependent epimerase/dehydratase family protein [Hyphomonadaceae bacterium]